ncbi:MAG: DUF374 domain-containing protein [Fibrobacter sp.]|nr:DUF374 domain-containing protein [Fibrobacter sp.]
MFGNFRAKLASLVVSLWLRSLRVRLEPPEGYGPGILGIWHRDLLACCAAFKDKGVHALISESRDGDFFSATARRLGYKVTRGSDSHGALNVRRLLDSLNAGRFAGMALDGPRGPAGIAKPGSLWLSRKSGRPLWEIQVQYGRHFSLHSWDRFVIPFPMSTIVVRIKYFCERSRQDDKKEDIP